MCPCVVDDSAASIWNLSLDKFRQQKERFLPAEITGLRRNGSGYTFLHHIQFGPARNLFQGDRRLHLAGQVRIIELVAVTNPLVWGEFEVGSPEGMAFAGGKIRE